MYDSYTISTVLAASSSTDLTTLAAIKDELSIKSADTGNDTWLTRAQKQASRTIQNYCNRTFAVQLYQDTFREHLGAKYLTAPNTGPLILTNMPVVAVLSIVEDGTELVAGTDYEIDLTSGLLYRLCDGVGRSFWRYQLVTVSYLAGYGVMASLSATVPPGDGPYTISVGDPMAFSVDAGVTRADGTAFAAAPGAPLPGQYEAAAGVYTFNAADAGAQVSINYGSTLIPDDVEEAALRLMTMRFSQKGRDPMLMSQSQPNLGDRRWWVGTTPGQDGALPPEIACLVDNYRSLSLA